MSRTEVDDPKFKYDPKEGGCPPCPPCTSKTVESAEAATAVGKSIVTYLGVAAVVLLVIFMVIFMMRLLGLFDSIPSFD